MAHLGQLIDSDINSVSALIFLNNFWISGELCGKLLHFCDFENILKCAHLNFFKDLPKRSNIAKISKLVSKDSKIQFKP